jgi:hypothetical protein
VANGCSTVSLLRVLIEPRLRGLDDVFVFPACDAALVGRCALILIVGSTILHCYLTAWYDLVNRAQLQAGETVLVTGAAGGVGLACVEFARSLGARVIAAVGAAWPTSANMDDFSTFFVTELCCRNLRPRSRR